MAGGIIAAVATFVVIGLVIAAFAYLAYRRILRRAKGIERGLKMVPVLINLPPAPAENATTRDQRELIREKIAQAGTLYDLIAGTAKLGFKSHFYGQRHISMEIVAVGGQINYYAAVPVALLSTVKQAVLTAYPGAKLEETEDHNIFNPTSRVGGVAGGELVLKRESIYPIATYEQHDSDPMEAIINVMSSYRAGEGGAVQILLRPANPSWTSRAGKAAKQQRQKGDTSLSFSVGDLAKAAVKAPEPVQKGTPKNLTGIEERTVEGIEGKTTHAAYEVLIRVVTSAESASRSQTMLQDLVTAFALFDAPGLNGFKYLPASDMEGLVTAFIFRFFPPELNHNILNSEELATLFHLPEAQFTASAQVQRQTSKEVDAPPNLPNNGLIFGYNTFRGVRREVRLTPQDRQRHTYIIGQTGTGKSTLLENLIVQDMLNGNGFAFIDPHGDAAEKLLGMVPKHRAEDVIYFNPGDTDYPLGLNLFEFSRPEQKDFIIQETISMLYKLYDPGHTGIIGPRFEEWFRNAALTLMADPNGSTFIEVPKLFTDTAFLKSKFKYVQDPTVIDFWTKEMAQTSDYHKSEMLGYFSSKFGAFAQNEIMRNIVGQTKSAFNLREIMDGKKILIVNLSKGLLGDLNSQLLGIMFVIKFQAAAMSRAEVAESARPDFCLYVDEFQNFSTDSFASILSEARKYHLNLVVANQFMGQLTDPIREAVFGNVGTILSFRAGPDDAEFLTRQFAPTFDVHDIVGLPNFHAVVRLMVGGLPQQPFSLETLSPLTVFNPELALAMKQLSAAKFGRTKQEVEKEIFARLSGQPAATTAPPPTAMPPVAPNQQTSTSAPPPPPSSPPATNPSAPELSRAQPGTASPAAVSMPPARPVPAVAQMAPVAAKPADKGELSIQDLVKDHPMPVKAAPPAPAVAPALPPTQSPPVAMPPTESSLSPKPTVAAASPTPITPTPTAAAADEVSESLSHTINGGQMEKALEKEISTSGLDQVIKIVEPLPDQPTKPPAPTSGANISSTLQGIIPVDRPTPVAVGAPAPVQPAPPVPQPTPEATRELPSYVPPLSQPMPVPSTVPQPGQMVAPGGNVISSAPTAGQVVSPAPVPQAAPTPAPAVPPPTQTPSWTPTANNAGTKPVLSGDKPADAGEIMVDEQGNVKPA